MAYNGQPNSPMMGNMPGQMPGMQGMSGMQNTMGMQSPPYSAQGVPYTPPWQQQGNYTPSQQNTVRVVPVASIVEAKAIPTDFMGTMLVMTDFPHGAIYTKVLDTNTGNPIFRIFKYIPDEDPAPAYDARRDIEILKAELNRIKTELGMKEADTNEHA